MEKLLHKALRKLRRIFCGFTIIELIVVIAIIGVLASIILASVTSYIGKSKDSRIKSELSEIAKSATVYYADYSTYAGYTIPSSFSPVANGSNYTSSISEDGSQAVFYAKLATGSSYWCVDSTGAITQLENPPDAGVYACTSGSGGGGGGGGGSLCYGGSCISEPSCSSDYNCQAMADINNYIIALGLAYQDNGEYPPDNMSWGCCLGTYTTEKCWGSYDYPCGTAAGEANNVLANYIPWLPGNQTILYYTSVPTFGYYYHSPQPSGTAGYQLFWLLEGSNQNCSPGTTWWTGSSSTMCTYIKSL